MFYLLFWAVAWASADIDIIVKMKSAKVETGSDLVLIVELYVPNEWQYEYSGPTVQGLEVSSPVSSKRVVVGERWRQILQFSMTGGQGSYIIEPGTLYATLPDGSKKEKKAATIYADIGEGISSELEGLYLPPDPPPEQRRIWVWLLVAGGLLLLVVAAWLLLRRPKPKLSPSEIALRDWELARNQIGDDHGLAIALSNILRRYIDTIFQANTINCSPSEANDWLSTSTVPDRVRPNASRIFTATNKLKFAREGGGGSFFDDLGRDLFLFIGHLRFAPARKTVLSIIFLFFTPAVKYSR